MNNKILNLVVVAHPDDEVLGFGATGAKLVKQGEIVQPVILCGNVDARTQRPTDEQLFSDISSANSLLGFHNPVLGSFPNIRMNTVDHVDLVRFIEIQIQEFKPDRIFTHHPADLNDDHVQVSKACLAAARLFQRRSDIKPLSSLNLMEILSATDWSFPAFANQFSPNTFFEVEDTIDLKISSLMKYRNVMRDFPHPRSETAIKGHAAYRGGQSGMNYAEAFQCVFKRGV